MTYFLQECECGANFYLVDVAIKQFDDAYTFYLCEHNVGPKARSKTNATNPFSINTRPFACWACTPRIEAEIAFGQMGRGGGQPKVQVFATDIDDYAAWTLARIARSPDFIWEPKGGADWLTPWEGWRSTRYEEKARREGRPSGYFSFVRR